MKRDRKIIITVLMLILPLVSYGQIEEVYKTSFGLKGGVNLSTIEKGQSNIAFSPDLNVGFSAGAFVNYHFGFRDQGSAVGTGLFGIQPELLFSQQGLSASGQTICFNYISLPILAKLYISKEFSFEVGPGFNYMLSASPNSTTSGGAEINIESLKGSKDVGIILGASYETKTGLLFDVRYNYGLSDVASNLAWKNQVIAISLGKMF